MPAITALMISRDPLVADTVRKSVPPFANLRLEICNQDEDALERLQREDVRVVLIHQERNNHEEVLRLLRMMSTTRPGCVTVVLADEYHNQQAVTMLRAGASDYLGLPQDLAKLWYVVDVHTLRVRANERGPDLLAENTADAFAYVLAPEMMEMMEQVRRIIPQDITVLLSGETGTGKTRLARLIHELSPRRNEPFLVVDCGALSASLIESEMFGHVRGAFTGADRDRPGKFAAVGRGTLLLDEINALPVSLQAKLLRAVDDRVFEPVGSNKSVPLQARLIAASNAPLFEEVAEGRFRSDLYYRLNVVGFYLPPLRDRRTAIPPLLNQFQTEFAARNRRDIGGVSPSALRMLIEYGWPGNIRELKNVIERAVALAPGPEIQGSDLPEAIRACDESALVSLPIQGLSPPHLSLSRTREEAELLCIMEALKKHRNNRLRAAADLGISRMALYKKLHKYGLINSGPTHQNPRASARGASM